MYASEDDTDARLVPGCRSAVLLAVGEWEEPPVVSRVVEELGLPKPATRDERRPK
jgi:hypothetical protein